MLFSSAKTFWLSSTIQTCDQSTAPFLTVVLNPWDLYYWGIKNKNKTKKLIITKQTHLSCSSAESDLLLSK